MFSAPLPCLLFPLRQAPCARMFLLFLITHHSSLPDAFARDTSYSLARSLRSLKACLYVSAPQAGQRSRRSLQSRVNGLETDVNPKSFNPTSGAHHSSPIAQHQVSAVLCGPALSALSTETGPLRENALALSHHSSLPDAFARGTSFFSRPLAEESSVQSLQAIDRP